MSRSAFLGVFPTSLVGFWAGGPSTPTSPLVPPVAVESILPTAIYHQPPPRIEVDYSKNPTVFGRILQGDLPCRVVRESRDLLAFLDRRPRAPFHALVIPKRYIQSVFALTPTDIELVQDMQSMALDLLRIYAPDALANEDYRVSFHIPPFNSVDHLHAHVLAPVSEMQPYYRHVKYAEHARWITSLDRVLRRLQHGQAAVPY